MGRPRSVNQMSAPRHCVGCFWSVCRVGLAGALQDACVPEGGHRQSPAPTARARGAPGCGAGTGYSETDTEDTHMCGPPRPGSVPVCPSWEVRLEGNILHKNDGHREMTDVIDLAFCSSIPSSGFSITLLDTLLFKKFLILYFSVLLFPFGSFL